MARLIDADKLIDFIDVGHLRHPGELCYSEADVANLLLHAPTVDAVEVVHCRDCKFGVTPYGDEHDGLIECSNIHGRPLFGCNDFCSYGERKDGAD